MTTGFGRACDKPDRDMSLRHLAKDLKELYRPPRPRGRGSGRLFYGWACVLYKYIELWSAQQRAW